jgi:fructose-bisphosphate aldolase class II
MLASTKEILEKANQGRYAVGHFNINNMEIVQGVVQAAINKKSPIILSTSEGAIKYAGLGFLHQLALTASEYVEIPIALHLDHGTNLQTIKDCINIGYSSVMIDASKEKFEKNIQLTKKVVQLAHKKGISVEAELGTIGGTEDNVSSKEIILADPEKTKEFVEKTGCDFLAAAIGTSHGAYKFKGKAELQLDILKQIKEKTKIPLVLHGASSVPKNIVQQAQKYGAKLKGVSGVPEIQLKRAIYYGINKVNTDTDLRLAFDAAIRKFLKENPKDFDPRHILSPARELITKVTEHRIDVLGSSRKG